MSFSPGQAVRVRETAEIDPLVRRFAGRAGRCSHPVASYDSASLSSSGDTLWVVAFARTPLERRALKANPHGDDAEAACSWVPVPASLLEAVNEETAEDSDSDAGVGSQLKRPRLLPPTQQDLTSIANAAVADAAAVDTATERLPAVCVIVCFRDLHSEQKRGAHLAKFAPHMEAFLAEGVAQGLLSRYRVFVVEQSADGRKFNRGKLLNIGFDLSQGDGFDTFVFHDVDLLPSSELLGAYCAVPPRGKPHHIARVWGRYNANPNYMGGVVAWNASDYEAINGYPNNYWGWGGEDDEMMRRCVTVWGKNFKMDAPTSGSLQDLEEMDLQEKLGFLRDHKDWKNYRKTELDGEHASTWFVNGLRTLKYDLLQTTTTPPIAPSPSNGTAPSVVAETPALNSPPLPSATFVRCVVDVQLNGAGQHDEWSGVSYLPEYLSSQAQPASGARNKRR